MLEVFFVATLLSVTDPAGDVGHNLAEPTAIALRQAGAFDLRNVTVYRTPTLEFSIGLDNLTYVPGALIELYLGEAPAADTSSTALLEGSEFRLPSGASWRYAFRIVGREVSVFKQRGGPVDITEASGAQLSVSGNTLSVQTKLPIPEPLSIYGVSGSFDPFSPTGWRQLRATPSPWGFSGDAPSPVLDLLADTPEVQERALEQGVLPEVRASASEPGWLALAGAGVVVALAGLAVRVRSGRQVAMPPAAHLAPFTDKDRRQRVRVLRDLSRVQGKLTLAETPPELDLEPAPHPEAVLN